MIIIYILFFYDNNICSGSSLYDNNIHKFRQRRQSGRRCLQRTSWPLHFITSRSYDYTTLFDHTLGSYYTLRLYLRIIPHFFIILYDHTTLLIILQDHTTLYDYTLHRIILHYIRLYFRIIPHYLIILQDHTTLQDHTIGLYHNFFTYCRIIPHFIIILYDNTTLIIILQYHNTPYDHTLGTYHTL